MRISEHAFWYRFLNGVSYQKLKCIRPDPITPEVYEEPYWLHVNFMSTTMPFAIFPLSDPSI